MMKRSEFLYVDTVPVNVQSLVEVLAATGSNEPGWKLRAQALVYATVAGRWHATGEGVTVEWIAQTLRLSRSHVSATANALVAKTLLDRRSERTGATWRYSYSPSSQPVRAIQRPAR